MKRILAAVFLTALVLWVGVAGKQTQPFPGPGSGIVTVAGTVSVGNSPSVQAAQQGEWKMAVSNTPEVTLAGVPEVRIAKPSFLIAKRNYVIIWGNGDRETASVAEVGNDGWVRIQQVGSQRWVNTSLARSIETGQ